MTLREQKKKKTPEDNVRKTGHFRQKNLCLRLVPCRSFPCGQAFEHRFLVWTEIRAHVLLTHFGGRTRFKVLTPHGIPCTLPFPREIQVTVIQQTKKALCAQTTQPSDAFLWETIFLHILRETAPRLFIISFKTACDRCYSVEDNDRIASPSGATHKQRVSLPEKRIAEAE